MKRRTFLKMAGMGSIAALTGCSPPSDKTLIADTGAPEDLVAGQATWYASTCRECPAGCGIVAKNREGRVVKIEGNPQHPVNRGALCMRGQSALQGLYNPDRIQTPRLKTPDGWQAISYPEARAKLTRRAREAADRGPDRIRMLTEVIGTTLMDLLSAGLAQLRSPAPWVFEPLAYEDLKAANREIFNTDGLISYRLDQADLLVSFGADFLETWLSPVQYARRFKTMHAIRDNRKGRFIQVSPYQSLTGANADLWLACRSGSEAVVALGLVHDLLNREPGRRLDHGLRTLLERAAAPFGRERVLRTAGIAGQDYDRLLAALIGAGRPLILGTPSTGAGTNSLQTNMAANLLNLMLDPSLTLLDFQHRHRVQNARRRSDIVAFFQALGDEQTDLLLLNNTNPAYCLPPSAGVRAALGRESLFVVSFSNFMDETSELADMVLPVSLGLETWDLYDGQQGMISTLQPVTGRLTAAPHLGDVFIEAALDRQPPAETYKQYLLQRLIDHGRITDTPGWVAALGRGGCFEEPPQSAESLRPPRPNSTFADLLYTITDPPQSELMLIGAPSLRFFDGRGANRPWLCEIPDPLTQVAWQTPVLLHPATGRKYGLANGDRIRVQSKAGKLEAPVCTTECVGPGMLLMGIGQGHTAYGRYAAGMGVDPLPLLTPTLAAVSGAPRFMANPVSIHRTGSSKLARTDGSPLQLGRKIALTIPLADLTAAHGTEAHGLDMHRFPLTLPLPEGYDSHRDIYASHDHDTYRWGMVVDLDRCIGCGACAAACYAENNLGVVGQKQVTAGREMSWLRVERYENADRRSDITFLPMMCQHCDNAPCEAVCPVYAPHHSKEGLNNQVYNRCIGTRFCAQNCPYKVRRFNWFDWQWPDPLHLQLNPNVTVRSKGVMEKCSFCVQRIKNAHNRAKNEDRPIGDGEVVPACVQTCPTQALVFGNLMDTASRVRRLTADPRAYQVMGYLNTKPAVIYLRKVTQTV